MSEWGELATIGKDWQRLAKTGSSYSLMIPKGSTRYSKLAQGASIAFGSELGRIPPNIFQDIALSFHQEARRYPVARVVLRPLLKGLNGCEAGRLWLAS